MESLGYNKGVENDLQVLSAANRYRSWLWDEVGPWLGQRVFEIGSGIGNYGDFLAGGEFVIFSDYDHRYVDILRKRYGTRLNVEVLRVDGNDICAETVLHVRARRPDTILCMNVLEHIRDDETCVRAMADCLPGLGRIVLVVPAMCSLYCELDVQYEHYRRYERNDAWRLACAAGLVVTHCSHFNLLGVVGWLMNGKWQHRSRLASRHVGLFDRLVPIVRWADYLVWHRVGLSLIIVLEKLA